MQMWKTRLMGPWGRSCRNLVWMARQMVGPLVEVLMVWGLLSQLIHQVKPRNRGARGTQPARPQIRSTPTFAQDTPSFNLGVSTAAEGERKNGGTIV